jgi:diadenylate cyclase
MESIKSVYDQTLFLLSTLTWFGLIDLALVTAAFYFLLSLIQRSSASYLIRELLVLGIALFAITALLPLPVFDWLLQGVLVAMLVAIPIIFQAQLRHFIERIGRGAGIARAARQDIVERALPEIVHAVEKMAASRTGALIVLEGSDPLEEIAATGISFNGRVASELLQSIFYSGTPLHDGAVIIRGDRVVAAGCVLPLTQQTLLAEKRLGTRHRAAVGMSEASDALVIVVSEEAGSIGVAQKGTLARPVTVAQLRERLVDFYDPLTPTSRPEFSLGAMFKQAGLQLWRAAAGANSQQLLSNLGLFLLALLLALVVWSFVFQQSNTIIKARVDNISFQVQNLPPNTRLIPAPPATISAVIQTTEEILPSLSPQSFQAVALLENSEPGLYRLPIEVETSARQILVLSVSPPAVDVTLTPIISKTIPVLIRILDQDRLSTAYELDGPPTAQPETVRVIGPAPRVEQVSQVQATILLPNAPVEIRETVLLLALDEAGEAVPEVVLQPGQVQVRADIKGRSNTREVGIQPVITGTLPSDYQISQLSVNPSSVTLRGSNGAQMSEIGNYIETLPIDVNQATTNLRVETPLNVPADLQVFDSSGAPVRAVTVLVEITERQGAMSLNRPVELLASPATLTAPLTLDPEQVTLLLIGPQTILNEIAGNPNLVRVAVDASDLRQAGDTALLQPVISAPEEVEVEIVPPSIRATIQPEG